MSPQRFASDPNNPNNPNNSSDANNVARALVCVCTFLLALTPAPHAQERAEQASQEIPAAAAPAHIALVDGAATVERDGQTQPATANAPFVPGDRLRTTTGRVEVLFPDGTVLDVDEYSAVDLQSAALVRLVSGRVILVVAGASDPASAVRYQIDTPVASARTYGAGEYRVAVLNGRMLETELAVLRGSASLATERGTMPVRAGERSVARDGEAPMFPQGFNSARFDAFDRWSAALRDERSSTLSSQYLPHDLRMYGGAFDRYGSWQNTSPYGYVWYPTVAPGWRPYYYGYWAPYRPWGWTWIGFDLWAWPTHHFGRWGFARSRWFWIPGHRWAPAWVSWGAAPGFVSWCPLGFDEHPVFAFSRGFASQWSGWTVVPQNSFGLFARVDRFAVEPHLVPPSTHFAIQRTAPVAVPRVAHADNVAIASGLPAGVAVPRSNPGRVWSQEQLRGQPGLGARDLRASPRAPFVAAPPSAHEFKQPLPEGFRSPGYAVPRERARSVPVPDSGRSYSAVPRPGDPMPSRSDSAMRRPGDSISGRAYLPRPGDPTPSRSYPALPRPGDSIPGRMYPDTPRSVDPAPHAVPRWGPHDNGTPAPRYDMRRPAYEPAPTYQPPPAHMAPMAVPRSMPMPSVSPRSEGSMPHSRGEAQSGGQAHSRGESRSGGESHPSGSSGGAHRRYN